MEPKSPSKDVSKGSEEVLIEIDGKFELVSAADMQANQPTESPNQKSQEASDTHHQDFNMKPGVRGKDRKKSDKNSDTENYDDDFEATSSSSSSSVDNTTSNLNQDLSKKQEESYASETPSGYLPTKTPEVVNSNSNDIQEKPSTDDTNNGSNSATAIVSDPTNMSNPTGKVEDQPNAEITPINKTDLGQRRSSVEIVVSEHNTQVISTNDSSSNRLSRTKSAPSRSTLSQYWEEAEVDRKERCESAYRAWLAKKDAQIAEERRLQRANTKLLTREEKLQKIEQCEAAYKAWLENKNRQVHERRNQQRAVKSASVGTSKECQAHQNAAAFRKWLEQKQQQRQKEREIETRRAKEETELAQKVDSSLSNQAYRQ